MGHTWQNASHIIIIGLVYLSAAHRIDIEISTYNATLLYRLLAPSTLLGLHEFCCVHLVFTVETVSGQRL